MEDEVRVYLEVVDLADAEVDGYFRTICCQIINCLKSGVRSLD